MEAGQRPDHNALEIVLSSQANQKDEAAAEETLEKLIAYYNDPHDWQQMIDTNITGLVNVTHALLPGMFVRARLEEGINPNALLVPQQAVTRTPPLVARCLVSPA